MSIACWRAGAQWQITRVAPVVQIQGLELRLEKIKCALHAAKTKEKWCSWNSLSREAVSQDLPASQASATAEFSEWGVTRPLTPDDRVKVLDFPLAAAPAGPAVILGTAAT